MTFICIVLDKDHEKAVTGKGKSFKRVPTAKDINGQSGEGNSGDANELLSIMLKCVMQKRQILSNDSFLIVLGHLTTLF